MYAPASPSFSRSRLTWVSTVRVVTSASMPQTSLSSASRVWTRPRRDRNAWSRRNSSAVSPISASSTHARCASRSILSRPNRISDGSPSTRCDAAEQRADPQDQLAHAERLDHVVVGADLEADHAIDLLALRRAHDHRDVAGALVLAQLAADLGARQIGQHQIEHDHVGQRVGGRAGEALSAAVREPHREALRAQVVLERGGEVDLVLDDQYEHDGALACSR